MMIDLYGVTGYLLSAVAGLCLGSFATALTWRIPRGESWAAAKGSKARSMCPVCQHGLAWFDLIPLLSWISLRGRCRYCGAGIGGRYPMIEMATVLGCLATFAVFGPSLQSIILMAAMPFLVALVAIDFEHMILPDQLNLILAGFGVGFAFVGGGLAELPWAFLAGTVYAGLSYLLALLVGWLLKKEVMGLSLIHI